MSGSLSSTRCAQRLREPLSAREPRTAHCLKQDATLSASTEISALLPFSDCGDKEALQATLAATARRQEEWHRQLQSVDEKQAELAHMQWKLIRDQSSSMAKELAILQSQLKDLKVDSRRALIEVERYFKENETKITEERGLRLAMCEGLEQKMKKMKQELELETKARSTFEAEVPPKLEQLAELLATRSREHKSLDMEVRRLRENHSSSLADLAALQQTLSQEASERRDGEATLTQMLREVRESLAKESQGRHAAEEAVKESVQLAVEQERTERLLDCNALRAATNSLLKDFAPLKEELPSLRGRLGEVENFVNTRLKDSQRVFEQELGERAAAQQRLDSRLTELNAALEKEASKRQELADETDHVLKSFRSKMKTAAAAQEESLRQVRESLREQLVESLGHESTAREALQASMHSALEDARTILGDRLEGLEAIVRDVDQRHQEQLSSELRELEANQLKLTEELSRQLRELRENFAERLQEERQARESHAEGIEEHLDFLEGFLQDARELFLQRGSRQRRLTARKSGETISPRQLGFAGAAV
eukprot:TRINITY_DN57374_c0_g1_i1.p1 TRINITY_DN57374_c0_g1~~TRINITY_DN57374_c0_g1_i1.p1  ORF type:complete len:544 (-),score=149.91 TRINITY_DN57374_c0_g1_i1:54-1685(-)